MESSAFPHSIHNIVYSCKNKHNYIKSSTTVVQHLNKSELEDKKSRISLIITLMVPICCSDADSDIIAQSTLHIRALLFKSLVVRALMDV